MNTNRMLHTMLRVGDLQKSIDFYTHVLGMRVLRTFDQPDEKYTLCFLGYCDEEDGCALELTYNYGITEYDLGKGYGHIAISVDDCKKSCEEVKFKGGEVSLEAVLLKGTNEIIAFVLDPDGYQVELIQR